MGSGTLNMPFDANYTIGMPVEIGKIDIIGSLELTNENVPGICCLERPIYRAQLQRSCNACRYASATPNLLD